MLRCDIKIFAWESYLDSICFFERTVVFRQKFLVVEGILAEWRGMAELV